MPYPQHSAMAGALLWAVVVAATLPAPAQAQIRRCTAPEGGVVYTDRNCDAVGAIESRPPPISSIGRATLRYRGGCARRLQDLVFDVTAAIDARDGNRLASSYHWVGMGHRAGYAMVERLDAISQRVLVNITVLGPPQPAAAQASAPVQPPHPLTGGGATALPTAPIAATAIAPMPVTPILPATPTPPRRPVALRIDQVLDDGVTPSSTTFQLRRHMDCWWISL